MPNVPSLFVAPDANRSSFINERSCSNISISPHPMPSTVSCTVNFPVKVIVVSDLTELGRLSNNRTVLFSPDAGVLQTSSISSLSSGSVEA